jgi:RHS repeat-associated protein
LAADTLNNLLSINQTKCSPPALSVGVNSNNQIITPTGYSYDSAGNSTADGAYSYTYDAENRITSASGMSGGPYCYTYDGNGLRVAKAHGSACTSASVDVLYWRSISGDTIAETDSAGSTSNAAYHEYIFFAGGRIARSDVSSGSVYFLFADHLGSTRAMTQANGTVCFTSEYYPYGQELNILSTCSTSYKFTGYERDAETGIDYAFARYYNPRMGRFMSGDPLGGDASDPQSHNGYSYTRSNPVNLTDPSGLSTDIPGFCDASMSSCAGGSGPSGPGRGSFGSAASQVWGSGMTQYLQQVYNSSIRIGPDGNLYRPKEQVCIGLVGGPMSCTDRGPWIQVGQSPSGNSGDWILWGYDVNTFVHGVLHGVRNPGESRGACILRNADETTAGQHDKLLAAAAWGAYSASALLTQVSAPQLGSLPGSAQSPKTWTVLAQTALTAFRAVARVAPGAVSFAAGRGAYYVGNGIVWGGTALAGAEAGLLIGSAINCR